MLRFYAQYLRSFSWEETVTHKVKADNTSACKNSQAYTSVTDVTTMILYSIASASLYNAPSYIFTNALKQILKQLPLNFTVIFLSQSCERLLRIQCG